MGIPEASLKSALDLRRHYLRLAWRAAAPLVSHPTEVETLYLDVSLPGDLLILEALEMEGRVIRWDCSQQEQDTAWTIGTCSMNMPVARISVSSSVALEQLSTSMVTHMVHEWLFIFQQSVCSAKEQQYHKFPIKARDISSRKLHGNV